MTHHCDPPRGHKARLWRKMPGALWACECGRVWRVMGHPEWLPLDQVTEHYQFLTEHYLFPESSDDFRSMS
jgi:hypothetical protein